MALPIHLQKPIMTQNMPNESDGSTAVLPAHSDTTTDIIPDALTVQETTFP